jgi:hypothetical protein
MWRGPFAYGHAGATRIRWGRDIESSVEGRFRSSHLTSGLRVSRPPAPEQGRAGHRQQRGERQRPGRSVSGGGEPSGAADRCSVTRCRVGWRGDAYRSSGPGRLRPAFARVTHWLAARERLAPRPRRMCRRNPLPAGDRLRSRPWTGRCRPGPHRAPDRRLRSHRRGRRGRTLAACTSRRGRSSGRRGSRRRCRRRRNDDRRRRGRRSRSSRNRRGTGRQQRQRVDVALWIVGAPDAEVDVRHVDLRLARRTDRPNRLALGDAVAGAHRDRPEMKQRHRVPVRRPDRQRAAVHREPTGERDSAIRRRTHGGACLCADVDPGVAVLAVLLPAEVEAAKHGTVGGPGPGRGGRRCRQAEHEDQKRSRCLLRQHSRGRT